MEKNIKINAGEKFLISKDSIVIEVSADLLDITGYTESELVGKSLMEISRILRVDFQINLQDMEELHNIYIFNKEGLAINVTISCEVSTKENIKIFYVKENIQTFLRNMLLNFEDLNISGKQALAIYSYPDCICLQTNEKYINSLNSIDFMSNDPIGKPYPYPKYISKIIEEGSFYEDEVEFIGLNGISTYWDMSLKLIQGDENKKYLLLSLYDVSRRVNEKKLLVATSHLPTTEMQNQMFSTISHELKTPLSVIFSASQLIELYLKKELNKINKDNISKNIDIIKQNCYRFTKLINNIIDLSRVESGFYKLDISNYNIIEIVEDVVDSVRSFVEGKGLEIIFDTEIEEKIIAIDVDRIERIILNLISNAVKYSHKDGKININISDRTDFVEILVQDYGVGINKEHINTIFDKYHRVDNSLCRNAEGSGIGLALVKTMVELLGGEISVESELGKGSLFTVKLPVKVLDGSEVIEASDYLDSRVERINIEFSDIYTK